MKIKSKIIYVLSGLLLLLVLWTFMLFRLYALPHVMELEKQSNRHYSTLVSQALEHELTRLATVAKDWAYWDELYRFAEQPTDSFRQSNLAPSTLKNMDADLLLILKPDGSVIQQLLSESATRTEQLNPPQDTVVDTLLTSSALYQPQGSRGMYATPSGLVAVVSSPIHKTDGSGQAMGTFILGNLLETSYVERLSSLLEKRVQLAIVPYPPQTEPEFTFTSQTTIVNSYLPLQNSRDHSLKATIERTRTLFISATEFAWQVLVVLLLSTAIICLSIYMLLEKIIIKPISELESSVKSFEQHSELPMIKAQRSHDEIGELSRMIYKIGNQVKDSWSQLQAERNDYLKASNTDPLTKLWNRRYVEATLAQPSSWSKADNWLFMMIDIDHFKQINDNFGHDAGDITIKQFASLLRYLSRTDDIVMRYGGEEFCLICRGVDEKVGSVIAERIRAAVASRRFGQQGASFKATCSIGFFTLWVDEAEKATHNWRSMLKIADMALYAAKNSGRNCWIGAKGLYSLSLDQLPADSAALQQAIEEEQIILHRSS